MICKYCQQSILLRSFRPPANECPHCGRLQNPDEPQSNVGCLVLIPVGIAVPMLSGFLGWLAGRGLAPVLNIPDLDFLLAVLAACDALGIVVLIHIRCFQGLKSQFLTRPLCMFLMFAGLGARCLRGHGLPGIFFAGLLNGVLATAIALTVLQWIPAYMRKGSISK